MPRATTYSPATVDAARILGVEVARARRERRLTINELAERAGVSRITVRAVEAGQPTVAIGTVFELATILGVDLFGVEQSQLPALLARGRERLTLLPTRVRELAPPDDDF